MRRQSVNAALWATAHGPVPALSRVPVLIPRSAGTMARLSWREPAREGGCR